MDPVVDISGVFRNPAQDPRIVTLLRELLEDEPLLFKDRLIYKMIGLAGTPDSSGLFMVAGVSGRLDQRSYSDRRADAENGALELFPGYHELLSAPGEMRHMNEVEARQIDFNSGELMVTEPGDVVIFHCMTPHRSGPNVSNRLRRQFYVTYSATKLGDLYERQLELFKAGRSSRRLSEQKKARTFFR